MSPRLRLIALAVPLLVILSLLVASPVRGQATPTVTPGATGTPVATPAPTATATPSGPPLPAGRDLLTKSVAALAKRNTQHFVVVDELTVTHTVDSKVTEVGDASTKPLMISVAQTGTSRDLSVNPVTTKNLTKVMIKEVKKLAAVKQGSKAWACTTSAKASQNALLPSDFIQGLDQADVQTVAIQNMNGAQVYKVRATQTLDSNGVPVPIVIDNYIRSTDFLPVHGEALATATQQGETTTESIVIDITKFGEKVKVTLPTTCKKASVASSALHAALLHFLLAHLHQGGATR